MIRSTTKALLSCTVAALLFSTPTARAEFIIDSGINSSTTQYRISSGSTVSYMPAIYGGEASGPFALSGAFTATVSNYWWDYFLDGDQLGTQGRFRYEASTIQFGNVVLIGAISPAGFGFPAFAAMLSGNEFNGSDHVCSGPLPPGTYCSGLSMPPIASFSGGLNANGLVLSGFAPVWSDFGGFNYAIVATAVPEPRTALLLALGLAALFAVRRRARAVIR